MLLFHYTTENKTLTQTPNGESPKTTFRKGAESGFCLWQELKNLNQKIAQSGEDLDFFSEMVRVQRIELCSRPWEGRILATIRYPRIWSHLGDSNPGPPLYESDALAN